VGGWWGGCGFWVRWFWLFSGFSFFGIFRVVSSFSVWVGLGFPGIFVIWLGGVVFFFVLVLGGFFVFFFFFFGVCRVVCLLLFCFGGCFLFLFSGGRGGGWGVIVGGVVGCGGFVGFGSVFYVGGFFFSLCYVGFVLFGFFFFVGVVVSGFGLFVFSGWFFFVGVGGLSSVGGFSLGSRVVLVFFFFPVGSFVSLFGCLWGGGRFQVVFFVMVL